MDDRIDLLEREIERLNRVVSLKNKYIADLEERNRRLGDTIIGLLEIDTKNIIHRNLFKNNHH